MAIWKNPTQLKDLNHFYTEKEQNPGTIHNSLGIEFTDLGDDYIEAKMPVDHRTKTPHGILHGGASVVLAESLGSVASNLVAGLGNALCVGIEINASHINGMQEGFVIGRATPIRLGKSVHVWDIQIRDGNDQEVRPVCRSRLTVFIKPKKSK